MKKKKPNPQGYYAYTKFKGEEIVRKYAKKYNYRYGILRYFNIAGSSTSGKFGLLNKSDHLFKNYSREIMKKKPILKIYGNNYKTKDGSCVRDFIHVSDIAEIHFKVLEKIKAGENGWEEMLPKEVTNQIKSKKLFGYK